MKVLYCGDNHVKPSNLKESQDLLDFIFQTALREDVSKIVFLGDLMDTHSIIRQEVNAFWVRNLKKLSTLNKPVIALIGNHDGTHIAEHETEIYCLMALKGLLPNINIVNDFHIEDGVIYHAYTHDSDKLIRNCMNATNTHTLVAHANFTQELFGDMINPDLIPQAQIIAGHVHSHHLSKGKVFYTGTPCWITATDAGEEKGIWLIDHEVPTTKEFLSTKAVVTPMYRVVIKEGEEIPELQANAKIAFELIGQSTWIATMKKKLKGRGSIKAVPMDRKHVKTDMSKLLNLDEYASINFKPLVGVSIEDITGYIRRIDGVQ